MKNKPSAIFFDKNDYQLLHTVNDVLNRGHHSQAMRSLLVGHMHPHGIKEMAAPQSIRIAYAITSLLGSLEKGKASDRIKALQSLRDEVYLSSKTFYQKNTARVLLQIMKELLRCQDNDLHRLKLAHDFRMVATGNPRLIRTELAKYHLLEMPEEWNQFAFDDHVHDANTKGRKSPTHLVMDAWIKGIRYLTVVYYNYIRPEVIEELIEASTILDINVQVGIEMSSRFRDKYVRFTWVLHGFDSNHALLKFLKEDDVVKLMNEGQKVSQYQQKYVFKVLDLFNTSHLETLNHNLKLSLKPFKQDDFLNFVGAGQPSLLHLARFIQNGLSAHFKIIIPDIIQELNVKTTEPERKKMLNQRLEKFKSIKVETLINNFLLPSCNPDIHDPTCPQDCPDLPNLLHLSPEALLNKLLSLHSSSKFTLNLSNLSVQDTLELLYAGAGMITHIETYNLKNADYGITADVVSLEDSATKPYHLKKSPQQYYSLINDLQKALNDDNVIILKKVIRAIIWDHEEQYLHLKKYIKSLPAEKEIPLIYKNKLNNMLSRKKHLMNILSNLETFHNYYRTRTLRSRIGSGSTGQAEHQYGMGLVVLETLPASARKKVLNAMGKQNRPIIPVTALLTQNSHKRRHNILGKPWEKNFYNKWVDWTLDGFLVHSKKIGNIATLGGLRGNEKNELHISDSDVKKNIRPFWKYLNTNLKNILKVLIGFIPAFLTFFLTKDWWLLSYFGAFIWFGITGSRNIIQSVLGGGGLRRSPLLPWNSLVSWSRISDSLLYTGFSVPLLDYLVKTLLLDRCFDINTTTNPILLYSVMGFANGIYISSHNILRGLPKAATIGNFFRSILSIPLAIILNSILGVILQMTGVPNIDGVLQKWAAIISKFVSDCVAAVIEGMADRQTNIQAQLAAYRTKISQLFAVFSRLEIYFPEEDMLEMLQSPKAILQTLNQEAKDQEKLTIVNALDLMYFWMYQPRSRKALTIILQNISMEEWLIFYRSQLILNRYKEISQIFVDGLVGKNFSKALSFYLDKSETYLTDIKKIGEKQNFL